MKKNHFSSIYWLLAAILILSPFQSFGQQPVANAMAPAQETLATASGAIAYIDYSQPGGDEIHLINPDGSNDRLLFSTNHPLPEILADISSLAWKPDASELAFASSHEYTCSLNDADIYTIRPDGQNYRRVTGEPACGSRAGFPSGTVIVPVYSGTDSPGPFVIYIEGAPGGQSVSLPRGGAPTTVTFENVADYGSVDQRVVYITADGREIYPNIGVDVLPDQTVQTAPLIVAGVLPDWGFRWPTYLPDGSTIATIFAEQDLYKLDLNGQVGFNADQLPWDFGFWGSALLWAPTAELQDNFLYFSGVKDNVKIVRESLYLGNANTGEVQELFDVDPNQDGNTLLGLAWLPDGSGFLYALAHFKWVNEYTFVQVGDLWEYSLDTGESTQLTDITHGYIRRITVSPDSSQVAFEYQSTGNWTDPFAHIDLMIMSLDGTSDATVLAENARSPVWSPAPIPNLNPVPALTGISPNSANAGGAAFTLTVNGNNFMNGSVVRWNGTNRTTTYVSNTKLIANIPAADITAAGSTSVTVFNPGPGGGTSNVITFSIINPAAASIKLYLPLIRP